MKISFDFDHCLTQTSVQSVAKEAISKGHQVWIVTSRFDNLKRLEYPDLSTNEDLFEIAKKLNIPNHRIGFTNQAPKWISLNNGNFSIHVDDDEKTIKDLGYYGIVKGVSCNAENFREKLFNIINEIQNF